MDTDAILTRHDKGEHPDTIAAALCISRSTVYNALRRERPNRARATRKRTSDVPRMVLGLAAQGIAVDRIAFLVGRSKAYCYRILAEGK